MNLFYLLGGVGFIAWFLISILSRELIENNKKIIIGVVVVLIILGIYVFPDYGEVVTMFFAGSFLGEYVYKKLFEKKPKVEEQRNSQEQQEKHTEKEENK
jgi:hypothetical protein